MTSGGDTQRPVPPLHASPCRYAPAIVEDTCRSGAARSGQPDVNQTDVCYSQIVYKPVDNLHLNCALVLIRFIVARSQTQQTSCLGLQKGMVNLLREISAGGIVFSCGQHARILMIRDASGRWTFPKGIIEEGETPEVAALREVSEETGVTGTIEAPLGKVNYYYTLNKEVVYKTVHYFLVRSAGGEPVPQLSEIREAKWVSPAEAVAMNGYENNLRILEDAVKMISSRV